MISSDIRIFRNILSCEFDPRIVKFHNIHEVCSHFDERDPFDLHDSEVKDRTAQLLGIGWLDLKWDFWVSSDIVFFLKAEAFAQFIPSLLLCLMTEDIKYDLSLDAVVGLLLNNDLERNEFDFLTFLTANQIKVVMFCFGVISLRSSKKYDYGLKRAVIELQKRIYNIKGKLINKRPLI